MKVANPAEIRFVYAAIDALEVCLFGELRFPVAV